MARYGNKFGACEIDSIPGCSQLAISHGVFIQEEYRHKGHGNSNHALRLDRAKELHYDYMLATVDKANEAERRNLTANGWKCLTEFENSKTGHWVEIWGVSL